MKKRLASLDIDILGLDDVGAPPLDIDESGADPLENARIKALAYYGALAAPVFSCDSGLFIEGLEAARQPGAHIRVMDGRRLDDDEEMIEQYSLLAAELGGRMAARYQHAICLVLDEAHVYEHMGEDIASEWFYIVSNPHRKRNAGFPLDSLSVHIASGKYYFDIDGYNEKHPLADDGFAAFFRRILA